MGRLLKDSDPHARLHRGARRVLQHAVEARQFGTDAHDSVRRSLRSLCGLARHYGVPVEQVVVICKDAWRTLDEGRELAPAVGTQLLGRVIAQCIDEYYRPDGADLSSLKGTASTSAPDSSLSFMFGPLS